MQELKKFLKEEQASGKIIYPPNDQVFNAFNSCDFEDVKVVIIGQDPYHGPGQAHGLSFSVQEGTPLPPSLRNIYKELAADLNVAAPTTGDLTRWAKQGVLLLNSVLTVEQGQPASHQGRGWEKFTDKVVEELNKHPQPLVFILWGAYAQKKAQNLDKRHFVLKSVHPSPLSASRGFFGTKPFSQANSFLHKAGRPIIQWND